MHRELILASSSKYRQELLARLGVPFASHAPHIDEDRYKATIPAAVELAETLSSLKAEAIFQRFPNACVIGSDQVVEIDGKILGKPHTKDRAIEQLSFMQGMEHALVTSICVMSKEDKVVYTDRTFLRMKELDLEQIERYLDYDQPYDCAGSYKLESRGIALFQKIEGRDHTAIQGLPLMKLAEILNHFGFVIP